MNAPRRIDQPRPGFFKMRLVRGGPFVAARIWQEGDALKAHINAFPADLDRVWLFGREIAADEYKRLMGSTLVASDPCDLSRLPSPF